MLRESCYYYVINRLLLRRIIILDNIEKILKYNETDAYDKHIRKKLTYDGLNKTWVYNIRVNVFCGDQIYEIINVINYMDKVYRQKVPITFCCNSFEFSDKLVYVILECICYYLVQVRNQRVFVNFNAKHTIWSEGIMFSPLCYMRDKKMFLSKYRGDLNGRHYRKIVPAVASDESDLSKIMQEILCFLQNNGVSERSSEELSEMLIELVGNSREHAYSETLIDIDLTSSTYTKEDDNNVFYGMNTAILNFSDKLFYEPLKEKISSGIDLPEKYDLVNIAYDFHKDFFTKNYDEKDFFMVSSFQDKISGSMKKKMGGRGLTTLITSLEEKADTHLCYVLSGNTVMFFVQDLLKYDDNKLVGFNQSGNYLSEIPDKNVIKKISTFFPGTSYNLSFVIKKEWTLE